VICKDFIALILFKYFCLILYFFQLKESSKRKMEKKKLKRKDVVYDDDTSDSSSDEEQVRSFLNVILSSTKDYLVRLFLSNVLTIFKVPFYTFSLKGSNNSCQKEQRKRTMTVPTTTMPTMLERKMMTKEVSVVNQGKA